MEIGTCDVDFIVGFSKLVKGRGYLGDCCPINQLSSFLTCSYEIFYGPTYTIICKRNSEVAWCPSFNYNKDFELLEELISGYGH